MRIKRIISIAMSLLMGLSVLSFSGCSNTSTSEALSNKPIIAVSIVPEQTFVEAVCGDLVQVVTIVPPGYSPESYEPTPKELAQLSDASLYFSIGVPVEEASILPSLGDIKVVSLAKEAAAVYPERTFESGERDPHIWLSPKRVKVMIEAIEREMASLDPTNSKTYEKNAAEYIAQLDALDKQISAALEGVQNKQFIVYHPAFGYLAEDYGLTMVALEEEGKEATAKHLEEMVDLAKAENIKVIFYQEEIDSSQSAAFAEEIGGKTMQLSPLAANYIENLKNMAEVLSEVME